MNPDIEFDAALLSRYDISGPRYTSYPTAPNFSADFGAARYAEHAQLTNEDPIPRPLSIYVHIPYCSSPCFYCGCNRVITRDKSKAVPYLNRLYREIEMQARLFDRDRPVMQLHLGGGTPNFLDIAQMRELVDTLANAFRFAPEAEREFGIEVDPRFADAEYIAQLHDIGFNRISLGVQDINPQVQEAINRIQPVEQTLAVINGAREAGFKSISVDLIYGLPRQTREGFADTLDTVIAAKVDRLAIYSYAHLPEIFKAQRQIEASELPTPMEKLGLLGLAVQHLGAAGYRYVGMDHFARPDDELVKARESGELQRNFQGYSTHAECDLIGLGVSAIGHVGDCFVQNARDLVGYDAAIDNGRLPIARGIALSREDHLRNNVIQSLMCDGDVDIAAVERDYEIDFASHFDTEMTRLTELERDGLVELTPKRIHITPRGRLLMRIVAMSFDAYLKRTDTPVRRFSRVI